MKADEVFILLLVIVSIGAVVALAVHSRRRENAAEAQAAQTEEDTAIAPQTPVNQEVAQPRERRKKRRR